MRDSGEPQADLLDRQAFSLAVAAVWPLKLMPRECHLFVPTAGPWFEMSCGLLVPTCFPRDKATEPKPLKYRDLGVTFGLFSLVKHALYPSHVARLKATLPVFPSVVLWAYANAPRPLSYKDSRCVYTNGISGEQRALRSVWDLCCDTCPHGPDQVWSRSAKSFSDNTSRKIHLGLWVRK